MIPAAASFSLSANRRVLAAVGFSLAMHALVLSGWHLRIFAPPRLASAEPIEVTLVAESTPRVARRTPPHAVPKPTPQPASAKTAVPEPRPSERTEAATRTAQEPAPAVQEARVTARFEIGTRNNPKPDYPLAARRSGMEGTVLLLVVVRADGTPGDVKVEKTSGYRILDTAAMDTVQRKWRFEPARVGNMPVEDTVRVPFHFSLQG